MKKVLGYVAKGGLGNRLRSLATSIHIAQDLDRYLDIYWTRYNKMGAAFNSLFINNGFSVYESAHKDGALDYFTKKYEGWPVSEITNSTVLREQFVDVDVVVYNIWCWGYLGDEDEVGGKRRHFRKKYGAILKNKMQWHPYIVDKVRGFAETYPLRECVGVHVRRGDIGRPQWKDRWVNEDQYHEALQDEDRPILLATNGPAVINSFKAKYPGRVIHYGCSDFRTDNDLPVQDAAVEMHLLSRCQYILAGPSSFSEVAEYMGGIKRIVLKQEEA